MKKLPSRLIDQDAVFSDDDKYRYWLKRTFYDMGMYKVKPCVFIMLNPSTADHINNDPTVTRCINFARSWECGELIVVNIFALRSTDPEKLYEDGVNDPVGPLNDEAIKYAVDYAVSNNGIVVCAWGNHGKFMDRGEQVIGLVGENKLHYLKMNKGNVPAHPLYLKGNLKPLSMENING